MEKAHCIWWCEIASVYNKSWSCMINYYIIWFSPIIKTWRCSDIFLLSLTKRTIEHWNFSLTIYGLSAFGTVSMLVAILARTLAVALFGFIFISTRHLAYLLWKRKNTNCFIAVFSPIKSGALYFLKIAEIGGDFGLFQNNTGGRKLKKPALKSWPRIFFCLKIAGQRDSCAPCVSYPVTLTVS